MFLILKNSILSYLYFIRDVLVKSQIAKRSIVNVSKMDGLVVIYVNALTGSFFFFY